LAYNKKALRVGLEYFNADNWMNVTTQAKDSADGYSVWFSYDFSPKVGGVARADDANLSKKVTPALEDKYFNVGIALHPRKNVDFTIAYKNEKVDGGSWNTGNGVIGAANGHGKYEEFGLWALMNF